MVILSSSLSLVIPSIQTYLQRHGEPAQFPKIMAFFPLFFTFNIFKILSLSILLVFLTLAWVLLLLVISGFVYFLVSLYVARCTGRLYEYDDNGLSYAIFEAAYQGWIRLTNLDRTKKDKDDPDPNPLFRRWSSIWYVILYSLPLLVILICCNTNSEVYIFDVAHWDNIKWKDLSLVKHKNGLYLNIIISTTLGIGAFGVLLDLLYYCCGHGVFIFQNKTN